MSWPQVPFYKAKALISSAKWEKGEHTADVCGYLIILNSVMAQVCHIWSIKDCNSDSPGFGTLHQFISMNYIKMFCKKSSSTANLNLRCKSIKVVKWISDFTKIC